MTETPNLRIALQQIVTIHEHMHSPAIVERFVLRNGREYTADKWHGRIMKQGECYKNAYEIVEQARGPIKYVEGFGLRPMIGLPIAHAWVGSLDGKAIDPTWKRPEECQYFGVEFDWSVTVRQLLKHEVWGLLQLPHINTDLIYSIDPELRKIVEDVSSKCALPPRHTEAAKYGL